MYRWTVVAALGSLMMAGSASAQQGSIGQGIYVGGSLDYAYFWEVDDLEYDILGIGVSGLAGIRMLPDVRLEGEFLYETADFDDFDGDIEVTKWTASVYKDLARRTFGARDAIPYVGVGGGVADVDFGFDDSTELTFHGEAGVSMGMGGNLEFVPGIRIEWIDLDGNDNQLVTQLRAGLRYNLF